MSLAAMDGCYKTYCEPRNETKRNETKHHQMPRGVTPNKHMTKISMYTHTAVDVVDSTSVGNSINLLVQIQATLRFAKLTYVKILLSL